MSIGLYVINLPYANFGITVENDIIIKAPPIGDWMINRNIAFVSQWVNKKDGSIEEYFPKENQWKVSVKD